MSEFNQGVNPAQAFAALQQYAATEAARYYAEIALRDAYIQQLQEQIKELEEKLVSQDG